MDKNIENAPTRIGDSKCCKGNRKHAHGRWKRLQQDEVFIRYIGPRLLFIAVSL